MWSKEEAELKDKCDPSVHVAVVTKISTIAKMKMYVLLLLTYFLYCCPLYWSFSLFPGFHHPKRIKRSIHTSEHNEYYDRGYTSQGWFTGSRWLQANQVSKSTTFSPSSRVHSMSSVTSLSASTMYATSNTNITKRTEYKHSEEIRMKISQKNKGKVSWNVGMPQSETTKAKIRESLQKYIIEQKIKRASALNLTLEEYENKTIRRQRQRELRNPNETPEMRQQRAREKLSIMAKERWEQKNNTRKEPRPSSSSNRTTTISEEAKKKISEIMKAKWQDPNYSGNIRKQLIKESKATGKPLNITSISSSAIKKTKTKKPHSPKRATNLTQEHRARIAEKIRLKWQDPEYREKCLPKNRTSGSSKKNVLNAPEQ